MENQLGEHQNQIGRKSSSFVSPEQPASPVSSWQPLPTSACLSPPASFCVSVRFLYSSLLRCLVLTRLPASDGRQSSHLRTEVEPSVFLSCAWMASFCVMNMLARRSRRGGGDTFQGETAVMQTAVLLLAITLSCSNKNGGRAQMCGRSRPSSGSHAAFAD